MPKYIKWDEVAEYKDLEDGDVIEISLGGIVYKTYITNGVQRFYQNKAIDFLTEEHNGKRSIDLNDLCRDYYNNKFPQRDYAEVMMMLGYSVCGFSELSSFHDMQLINPIWNYTQPDDTYLCARYEKEKITRDELIQEIAKRDGVSEKEALEYILPYIE